MNPAEAWLDVELRGGPVWLPSTVKVSREEVASGLLKIPAMAGYEHFVIERSPEDINGKRAVFSWCGSTKVAE